MMNKRSDNDDDDYDYEVSECDIIHSDKGDFISFEEEGFMKRSQCSLESWSSSESGVAKWLESSVSRRGTEWMIQSRAIGE